MQPTLSAPPSENICGRHCCQSDEQIDISQQTLSKQAQPDVRCTAPSNRLSRAPHLQASADEELDLYPCVQDAVDQQPMTDMISYFQNSGAAADGLHNRLSGIFWWAWNSNAGKRSSGACPGCNTKWAGLQQRSQCRI